MTSNIDTLLEYGFSRPKVIEALKRCGDDLNWALDWVFSEEGEAWVEGPKPEPAFYPTNPNWGPQPAGKDVRFDSSVDSKATGDTGADEDDDLKRAMALSMDDTPSTSTDPSSSSSISTSDPSQYVPPRPPTPNPNFTPSTRSDPENKLGMVQLKKVDEPLTEEQNLQRAMDESLLSSSNHGFASPPSDTVRSPGTPVCLWSGEPPLDYLAAIFQGLYAVPQLRALLYPAVLRIGSNAYQAGGDMDNLLEFAGVFEDLDLSDTSYLDLWKGDRTFPVFPSHARPVEATKKYLELIFHTWHRASSGLNLDPSQLSPRLLDLFSQPAGPLGLFSSSGCSGKALPNPALDDIVTQVVVELYPSEETHSIPLAFAKQLWTHDGQGAFIEPAEVMALTLDHPVYGPRRLFDIQEEFYIDRFLAGNSSRVAQLRANEGVLRGDEAALRSRRDKLATVKGKDVRSTLVTVLKYYKEVARPSEDPVDRASLLATTAKLEKLIAELDNEQDSIASSLKSISESREKLFDQPELRKYKYELRAILYHDGIYGTGHIYTYVRTSDGKWWKMNDGIAKEVESKQALGDASGLHLGAGPFALLYSRAEDWPLNAEFPDIIGSSSSGAGVESGGGGYVDLEAGMGGGGFGFEAAGGKDSWVPPPTRPPRDATDASSMEIDSPFVVSGGDGSTNEEWKARQDASKWQDIDGDSGEEEQDGHVDVDAV